MIIMVGFDGSKTAQAAMEVAETHAMAFRAKVLLVTSMEGGYEVPREAFVRAEKSLGYEEARFHKAGIECQSVVSVRGLTPGEDLILLAKEQGVEEIVIGVRRRSQVGKMLFGSTAQHVILQAPCPVVCVK